MKIAIIGTGISGMAAAYLLNPHHEITVYEKNAYVGGHSRTIELPLKEGKLPVDTGFIVFNDRNYPHLMGLFKELHVPYEKSDMSFGVSINQGYLEYGSKHMTGFSNLRRLRYWGMLKDILVFNRKALAYLERHETLSLKECLDELNMGEWFRDYYLLAMGAAIWSCPIQTIMSFPAKTFLRFFHNHGLLTLNQHPQWYTVTGGSKAYIQKLTASFSEKIHLNAGVYKVVKTKEAVDVYTPQGIKQHDQVIFACHANEALSLIQEPTDDEQKILAAFSYQKNQIVVHQDDSFMPRNQKCWSSWVYLSETKKDEKQVVSLSYWMNSLQHFKTEKPVLVTLNPGRMPQQDLILDQHAFSHPIFDQQAILAQERIPTIQGKRGFWFCGAYQRYGFHEDGLLSAVQVAKGLGQSPKWC